MNDFRARASSRKMILVTYNLRSGGAGRVHWRRALDELRPDIFLVQETAPPDQHLPLPTYRRSSRRINWSAAAGRRWGSAVYSSRGKSRPIALPDFQGHVVGVELVGVRRPTRARGPLRVFSVHAPFRGSYHRAMNSILDMIATVCPDGDLVIGGDFNVGVSERHSSESLASSKADLAIQRRLRDEFQLVNCWQSANPDRPLAQTLRWTNAPATPYHCDGLFVPQRWLPYLESCEAVSSAEWDAMSDHSPVAARFKSRSRAGVSSAGHTGAPCPIVKHAP